MAGIKLQDWPLRRGRSLTKQRSTKIDPPSWLGRYTRRLVYKYLRGQGDELREYQLGNEVESTDEHA